MTAKKTPTKKPRKLLFKGRGGHAICHQTYHNGQRFVYSNLDGRMYATDAARFAAWLTKAAAWCKEGKR